MKERREEQDWYVLEHKKVELEIREMLAPRPSSLEIPALTSVFKILSDLIYGGRH